MDTTAYPEMLLAAVARSRREEAQAMEPGSARSPAASGSEFAGCVAPVAERGSQQSAFDRKTTPSWLSDAIGSGEELKRLFQPPDAENRTSGGVGGCRGAIPGTRPDHQAGGSGWLSNGSSSPFGGPSGFWRMNTRSWD